MTKLTRRLFLGNLAASALLAADAPADHEQILAFLESHRKPDEAYGWKSLERSHITPTFAVVGCYRLLHTPIPNSTSVANFARNQYPVAEIRRTERPLWRLDFEQVQTLLWLDQPVDSFRNLAETWTSPADFTKAYELDGYPVFQHQAMAVRVRQLVHIPPARSNDQWRAYFRERRRTDGTFNNTPASDGSGGHILNTLWGYWALQSLGEHPTSSPELISWIRRCQLPTGGFTYAPKTSTGGLDDIAYTWAAVSLLTQFGSSLQDREACIRWVHSLRLQDGGYCDRPGGLSNPTATFYALDTLRLLQQAAAPAGRAASVVRSNPIPPGSRVFTIQIEAPGAGSPREAVWLAEKLGIDIWAAKNAAPGWIKEAQRAADTRKVPVLFAVGDEEYGTYVNLPGLGTYSHLDDLVAPPNRDFGPQMPKKKFAYPWADFRDTRIRALKAAGGRMIWQFNENEELTRILLDEAVSSGTYGAISTFHFGNENFLDSQPFLMRWYGLLPMIALQDAHGGESWWWGDFLSGFRTLFIGKEPSWQAWLEALDRQHVIAVRNDRITNWQLQLAGGLPHVQEFVMAHQNQWCWWGKEGETRQRPPAVLTVLRPGMPFEAGVPSSGTAIRLRLWADNTGQAKPKEARAELVSLEIDGTPVQPTLITTDTDRYYLYNSVPLNARQASAVVRVLATGKEIRFSAGLSGSELNK